MKKVIALNLKMNLDYEEAHEYVSSIKDKISDKNHVILFPSFVYLDLFKKSGYHIGAQNVHGMDKGAFTGEVSPLQLKTMGIKYAIVGHSERRVNFHESNSFINEKIKGCLRNNIKVILCIGETDEERRLRKTATVLQKQIIECLKGIDIDELSDVCVAYEPVWAIGTGRTPTALEIEDSLKYIMKVINREFSVEPNLLYGGSVNKDNIKNILSIKNVDGVLIGSSSVDPKYMLAMIDLVD